MNKQFALTASDFEGNEDNHFNCDYNFQEAKKALRHAMLYTPQGSEVQILLMEYLNQLNQIKFVYPCTHTLLNQ